MRYILTIILFAVASVAAVPAFSQNTVQENNTLQVAQDTAKAVVQRAPLADSSLVGTTIMQLLEQKSEGSVKVNQPQEFNQAYEMYVKANGNRKINGYRIRLFFDNKQTARVESEELEKAFQEKFPQIPTYRTYTNPFFKVVVGDYRTKSEAIKELGKIQPFFPKAIVVKESIFYPAI